MGLIDKAAEQAGQLARQGLEYVEESQARVEKAQATSEAEVLLRDLGAWTYATAEGRDGGRGPEEVERLTAELRDLEARSGQVDLSTSRTIRPEPGPTVSAGADLPADSPVAAGPEVRVDTGSAPAPDRDDGVEVTVRTEVTAPEEERP